MKHTPEPWKEELGIIYADIGIQPHIAYTHGMTDTPEENAARIVACMNACKGMDDPAKEIAALRAQVEKMHAIAISIYHAMEYDEDMSAMSEMRTAKFSDRLKAALAATGKE